MSVAFLEWASFWLNWIFVFLTLLTALVGIGAWHFTAKLGAAKDAELARFRTGSEASIAAANARAAEANQVAAQAGEGTATALKDAGVANERASKLEVEAAQQRERAAKADERAAKAERDLVELKHRTAPRRLSSDQRAAITTAQQRVPRESVRVTTVSNDEAQGLADDIVRLLRAAGWTVDPILHGNILPTPYGIMYFTGRTPEISPSMRALLEAMKMANIGVPVVTGGDPGFLVGLKPVAR
jgi:hypothetical protein